jgi:subtilisin-like proprotein convertase family protein
LNNSVTGGSASGITQTLRVAESYTVEAMQVRVSATSCIGNLGIELTSPAGTKSVLMNINSNLSDTSIDSHTFLTNAFYGENSAGDWSLTLIGGKSGCTTTWKNWQLNVMGH